MPLRNVPQAQRRVPQFSLAELLAAHQRPDIGGAVKAGFEGLQKGQELSAILADKKLAREKQQQEMQRATQQREAEEALIREASAPVPTSRTISKPGFPTISPVELPSGELVSPEGPSRFIPPSSRQVPLAQEEIAQAEQAKQQKLKGLAIAAAPSEFAKSLAKEESGRGKVTGRDIQQFYLVSPDGKDRIPVTYDEVSQELTHLVTKQPVDSQKYADYQMIRSAPQIRTDASGNLMIVEPTLGTSPFRLTTATAEIPPEQYGTVTSIQALPTTDRREVQKVIEQGRKDENAKKARAILLKTQNLRDAVLTDNKVLIDRLGGQTQKIIAEDVGNLAQWEQRDPGARDYYTRFINFLSMGSRGVLAERNKSEFLRLLDTYEQNYIRNLDIFADQYAESLVEIYPQLNKEAMKAKMGYGVFQQRETKPGSRTTSKGISYEVE
jgi:flagellar motor protein MotB